MAKRNKSFYDRPIHQRLATRITDGLISAVAVYFLAPHLIKAVAPVQAQINANAAASGASVSNVGTSGVANQLLAALGS